MPLSAQPQILVKKSSARSETSRNLWQTDGETRRLLSAEGPGKSLGDWIWGRGFLGQVGCLAAPLAWEGLRLCRTVTQDQGWMLAWGPRCTERKSVYVRVHIHTRQEHFSRPSANLLRILPGFLRNLGQEKGPES